MYHLNLILISIPVNSSPKKKRNSAFLKGITSQREMIKQKSTIAKSQNELFYSCNLD